MELINKLRQAKDITGGITKYLSPAQFIELAKNHSIPHYILTNPITKEETILFFQQDVYDWFEEYQVKKINFRFVPELVFLKFDSIGYSIQPTDIIPPQLSLLKYLYKLPIANLHTPPGIYFLCLENQIVYVGKAVDIRNRVMGHKNEMVKQFDSVYFICAHIDQLLRIEEACIKFFNPPYNSVYANSELNEANYNVLNKILIRPLSEGFQKEALQSTDLQGLKNDMCPGQGPQGYF